jgi:hypothetical protein
MRFLPSKLYVRIHYEYFSGKKLDLDDPQDFNAKIEWYKVFYRPKILNTLVDKLAVRDFVKEKIGKQFLNDLLGVYEKGEDIPFHELPDKFVLKANHTNNCHLIVTDKSTLDYKKVVKLCNKWLRKSQYHRRGQEWAYKDVKPKIVVEKLLEQPGRESLIDYKFYCFNGVAKFVDVHIDRASDHKQTCFDLDFNVLPYGKGRTYTSSSKDVEKPSNFKEMIEIANLLSQKLPFVRVDLYAIAGKTIFGELTFYPSDARKAFHPEKYNKLVGDYFILPELNNAKEVIRTFVY